MKTIIIAEAGVNHDGKLKKAFKLVDVAKSAGADYVKFQTFIPDEMVIKKAICANYQKKNSKQKNQYQMLKKLFLSFEEQRAIFNYCKKKKNKVFIYCF